MKRAILWGGTLFAIMVSAIMVMSVAPAKAADVLRYSCSPQIYEAFGSDRLAAFSQKTGIKVDLGIYASPVAVERLMNDVADIAGSAQRLSPMQAAKGYVETPFCRDPMAIIVNAECPVTDISHQQLQAVFEGKITNWKELGGPDKPILVITPSDLTAAHRNFSRDVLEGHTSKADIVTNTATLVIETTRRMPWSISFSSQGAARLITHGLKKLKINGVGTEDPDYPFFQTFSFITRGTPSGVAKRFIDFSLSPEGKEIIRKKGMIPAN